MINCWQLQFGVEGNIGEDLGLFIELWRCSGRMVSALVSRSSCPGSCLGRRHYIVFLRKTLYFHSASLFPGALMGTGELNAGVTL